MPFITQVTSPTPGIETDLGMHAMYITCYAAAGLVTLRKKSTGEAYTMRPADKIRLGTYTQGFQIASTVPSDTVTFQYSATDEYLALAPIYQNISISGSFPSSVLTAAYPAQTGTGVAVASSFGQITAVYAQEAPFTTLTISGTYTGLFIIPQSSNVNGAGITLFDVAGNVLAVPQTNHSNVSYAPTYIPNPISSGEQTYYFDSTGLTGFSLQFVAGGTGTATAYYTASHTQDSIFNSLPKLERTYYANQTIAASGATDIAYIQGVAYGKITVKEIDINIQNTNNTQSVPVTIVLESTAPAGTPVSFTVAKGDTSLPAASSTPTFLVNTPAVPGSVTAKLFSTNVIGTNSLLTWTPSLNHAVPGVALNGATEYLAVNLGGVLPSGAVVNLSMIWTEK
jgi:hypothetical protein